MFDHRGPKIGLDVCGHWSHRVVAGRFFGFTWNPKISIFANPNEYVHSAFSRKKHQSISVTVDCKTNLVSSVKCQGFVFIRPAFFVWLSKQIKMLLTLTTLALLTQTLHLLLTSGEN